MPDVASSFPGLTHLPARDDIVSPQGSFVKPMGSIRERRRQDGSIGYTAQIILKRKGKPTYREAATFDRRGSAQAWLKNREAALKEPGGIERAKVRGLTLADAIDRYVTESLKDIGRTKAQVLETIKGYDIGKLAAGDIGSRDIVAFAQELAQTVKPQTVQNYLSHLSAVFAIAKPAWGIPLDREAMNDAFAVAKRLGLTSKSDKRDRRPTLPELDKLLTHFVEREGRSPESAPMHKIIAFAIFSTRRQDEITRIAWRDLDLDSDTPRILVRDMKHPGQKKGNDVWCDLTSEAVAIIQSMDTESKGRIFPYTADAISAAFTRACQFLDIEDLHFHDLRHEGISRLFEMGWHGGSVPHVAGVSGHRSWSSLQRYTHLRQAGDKYAGWKWLPIVTGGSHD